MTIALGLGLRTDVIRGSALGVTSDRNLEYQQTTANLSLSIVALRARSNDIADLKPLMPAVNALLPSLKRGQVTRVPS